MPKRITSKHVHQLVDLFFEAGAVRELPEALVLLIKEGEAAASTTVPDEVRHQYSLIEAWKEHGAKSSSRNS